MIIVLCRGSQQHHTLLHSSWPKIRWTFHNAPRWCPAHTHPSGWCRPVWRGNYFAVLLLLFFCGLVTAVHFTGESDSDIRVIVFWEKLSDLLMANIDGGSFSIFEQMVYLSLGRKLESLETKVAATFDDFILNITAKRFTSPIKKISHALNVVLQK